MTHGCCNPNEPPGLLAQSWNAAVLGSHASKSVCGQVWQDNSVDLLNQKQEINIQFVPSSSVYRFGDGKTFNAVKKSNF